MLTLFLTLAAFATPTPVYGRLLTAPDEPISGLHTAQIRVYGEEHVAWESTQRIWLDDGWFSVVADLPKGSYGVGIAVDNGEEGPRVPLNKKRKPLADIVLVPGLPATPPTSSEPPVAWVEGVPISMADLREALVRVVPSDPTRLEPSVDQVREALTKLVEEEMLFQASMEQGLARDPKVKKVLVNQVLRDEVYSNVTNANFSEEAMLAYWEAHRQDFMVPEKVQLKRIFITTNSERSSAEAQERAEELRGLATKEGASFQELAVQHSEDPYKRRGGDLGFVSREGKPGISDKTIQMGFDLRDNEISEVFQTDGGFEFVMKVNTRPEVVRDFDQMKGSVLRKMKNERYTSLHEAYLNTLRQSYVVQIDEGVLATVPAN